MELMIKKAIKEALNKLNISKSIILTESKNFGDYSSNIAMSLQKDLNKKPMEIAAKIASYIDKEKFLIKQIQIIEPGFMNFFLDNKFYVYLLDNFSKNNFLINLEKTHSYNLEYVSANPTGFLHIGHARGAAIGDTLANILEFSHNKVTREYYINDAGNQIKTLGYALYIRYQQLLGNKDAKLPEDSYHGEDIKYFAKILQKQFDKKYFNISYDSQIQKFFETKGTEIALNKIKKDLKKMRVEFDVWASEKSMYPLIPKAIKNLKNVYQKDNAIWLETSKFGDDKDRVLIKSDGTYTYFTPDLVYHYLKKTRNGGVDYLIDFFGADHIGYVKRMQVALQQFGFDNNTLSVLILELVKLVKNGEEFKMSKRKGNVVSLEYLIKLLGADAARFFLVDRSNSSKMELDIDLIKEKNLNNGVFIIQYAHARANSIIKKSKIKNDLTSIKIEYNNKYELRLLNKLKDFPILIEKISKNFKIHLLPQYLISLAKDFNSFYSNSKIINTENEIKLLLLVKATKNVLKKGLTLLKVSAPERM